MVIKFTEVKDWVNYFTLNGKETKMQQRMKLYYLPTSNDSNLYLYKDVQWVYVKTPRKHKEGVGTYENHHLYITNDWPIKEGDWVLIKLDNEWQLQRAIENFPSVLHCRRLVLTTDTSLNLPLISPELIETFAIQGGKIVNVNVEVEQCVTKGWVPTYNNPDNSNLDTTAELDYRIKIQNGFAIVIPANPQMRINESSDEDWTILADILKYNNTNDLNNLLQELYGLIEELPVDWIGTGTYQVGDADEKAWNNKYKTVKEKLTLCLLKN